jgi:hypothetical protein
MAELDFLKLPWEIQGALASGYAAYAIAYTGMRERQRPIDIAFLSLVFSIPATLLFGLLARFQLGPMVLVPLAFVVAIGFAIIWRRFLRPHVFPLLRKLNVSWSNDDTSALTTLSDNSKFKVTQAAVLLDDGTWLRCDTAQEFAGAPFAPYLLGANGDIALYLTHEVSPDGTVKTLKTVRDSFYGDRITYIPTTRIRRITIRHKGKANHHSMEAPAVVSAEKREDQLPASFAREG